ncbi:hypothetical protein CPLU01_14613 [Colletotrichum plurivorum]|uniref:Uncharacterized protein n=1 Tax=Colletotrichum plurivorum TaxID=2175906 RepID=A0A8H6JJA1_9PEZI|nr:hypothetical protein CPLU01_14613 [Colletotrichum plurivorum]
MDAGGGAGAEKDRTSPRAIPDLPSVRMDSTLSWAAALLDQDTASRFRGPVVSSPIRALENQPPSLANPGTPAPGLSTVHTPEPGWCFSQPPGEGGHGQTLTPRTTPPLPACHLMILPGPTRSAGPQPSSHGSSMSPSFSARSSNSCTMPWCSLTPGLAIARRDILVRPKTTHRSSTRRTAAAADDDNQRLPRPGKETPSTVRAHPPLLGLVLDLDSFHPRLPSDGFNQGTFAAYGETSSSPGPGSISSYSSASRPCFFSSSQPVISFYFSNQPWPSQDVTPARNLGRHHTYAIARFIVAVSTQQQRNPSHLCAFCNIDDSYYVLPLSIVI